MTARVAEVRDRIALAAQRSGRNAGEVGIVGATKTRTPEEIAELYETGAIAALGENRIQEALPKIEALSEINPEWHFIGRLQSNKVRFLATGGFSCVHSVDRASLVPKIAERAPDVRVLVEVNMTGEASKAGSTPSGAESLCVAVIEAGLELGGLMTMAPEGEPGRAQRCFSGLRELRDELEVDLGIRLGDLSMGMTDDYEAAVTEGATLLRIGRGLFGPRISG